LALETDALVQAKLSKSFLPPLHSAWFKAGHVTTMAPTRKNFKPPVKNSLSSFFFFWIVRKAVEGLELLHGFGRQK
jgi:hypothetical protein